MAQVSNNARAALLITLFPADSKDTHKLADVFST